MSPTRGLIALVGALLILALALGIARAMAAPPAWLGSLWWSAACLVAAAALLDALRLRRQPSPEVTRQLPGEAAVGRWQEVRLQLRDTRRHRILLFDHLPETMSADSLPASAPLRPGETTTLSYLVRPEQRGHFYFNGCEIVLQSPLRLWQSHRLLPLVDEMRVYPDFTRLHGARLMAVDNWLSRIGVRQRPRRGLGQEFHQLREYREGDALRQVDWKATARTRQPIVREYQDERDQRLVFLLDCGRRMRSRDGDQSHFDHALEACLLLAHVALRQGDAVGLSTFATQRPRFVAPAKGPAQLTTLLNAMYDLRSSQRPSDFSEAAVNLLARQQRRALVIVLTNLRDEDDDELGMALAQLRRRHRVLLVSLREEIIDRLARRPVESFDDALEYCGLVDYREARQQLHRRLGSLGLPLMDARPAALAPRLIERYLEMKKAGAL